MLKKRSALSNWLAGGQLWKSLQIYCQMPFSWLVQPCPPRELDVFKSLQFTILACNRLSCSLTTHHICHTSMCNSFSLREGFCFGDLSDFQSITRLNFWPFYNLSHFSAVMSPCSQKSAITQVARKSPQESKASFILWERDREREIWDKKNWFTKCTSFMLSFSSHSRHFLWPQSCNKLQRHTHAYTLFPKVGVESENQASISLWIGTLSDDDQPSMNHHLTSPHPPPPSQREIVFVKCLVNEAFKLLSPAWNSFPSSQQHWGTTGSEKKNKNKRTLHLSLAFQDFWSRFKDVQHDLHQ